MIRIATDFCHSGSLVNADDAFDTVAQSVEQLVFAGSPIYNLKSNIAARNHVATDLLQTNKLANFVGTSPDKLPSAFQFLAPWLENYRKRTNMLNAVCLSHIAKISKALTEADVEFIVFKGVIQQKVLYGSYFVKPAGDVDLLVHERDFSRARAVLKAAGFTVGLGSSSTWWTNFLGEQHLETQLAGSPIIDLHYRIQQPGSPQPSDTSAFIRRKHFIDVAGIRVPFMHPDDLLLMSSISIAKAMFNREPCGGHVADIHASLCHLQPQTIPAIEAFSEQQGLSAMLTLGLRSAKAVFGVDHAVSNIAATGVLPSLSDVTLRNLLLLPDEHASDWPKRREVLWELCDRAPVRFAKEASWALAAEMCRRFTQKEHETGPAVQSAGAVTVSNSQMIDKAPGFQNAHSKAYRGSCVCVVIAAHNAEKCIARAVSSALDQFEVSEVIVVDDASSDSTASAARLAEDGSNRLKIIELSENVGPAQARNIAIDNSNAPMIAVLDSDDFFLKDRFKPLVQKDDWDFVADNIVFLNDAAISAFKTTEMFSKKSTKTTLSFADFVAGNLSKQGLLRGELGFLKPVMKRAFLDRHKLRYAPGLRLGEDYELYSRALLKQARFKISSSLGYGAVIRSDSLSAQHRTSDLKALADADRSMLVSTDLADQDRSILKQHERQIHGKYALRHFLDLKNGKGILHAAKFACSDPSNFAAVASGVARDKSGRLGLAKAPKTQANLYRDQQVLFPIDGIGASQ